MSRPIAVVVLAAASSMPLACTSDQQASKPDGGARAAQTPPTEKMTDDDESPPPRTTVSQVMRSKLAHAQAILEGLSLGNFAQVETNAMSLKRISQGGEWLAHESPAYFTFSAEFREICDDMVVQAQARNLKALADSYANLTNSCVACHEYLRRDREVRDLPGRISLAQPQNESMDAMKGTR